MHLIPTAASVDDGRTPFVFVAWRWTRILTLIYLTVCAAALFYLVQPFIVVHTEVSVPAVVGSQGPDAVAKLDAQGLSEHTIEDRSDGYPTGTVMFQSPDPGTHVRQGRIINLIVCSGPIHVVIPDLKQAASADAMQTLTQLGLTPSVGPGIRSMSLPFDSVVTTMPPPGSRVEVGSPIELIVSQGPPDGALLDTGPGGTSPLVGVPDPSGPAGSGGTPEAPGTSPPAGAGLPQVPDPDITPQPYNPPPTSEPTIQNIPDPGTVPPPPASDSEGLPPKGTMAPEPRIDPRALAPEPGLHREVY